MVTCQSSELGWEVTVELPADFLSLGRGSVSADSAEDKKIESLFCTEPKNPENIHLSEIL